MNAAGGQGARNRLRAASRPEDVLEHLLPALREWVSDDVASEQDLRLLLDRALPHLRGLTPEDWWLEGARAAAELAELAQQLRKAEPPLALLTASTAEAVARLGRAIAIRDRVGPPSGAHGVRETPSTFAVAEPAIPIEVARAVLDHLMPDANARRPDAEHLLAWLLADAADLRAVDPTVEVALPLDHGGRGSIARLGAFARPGRGNVYRDPTDASTFFLRTDPSFTEGISRAVEWFRARHPAESGRIDVCWRLRLESDGFDTSTIEGSSVGLAMAIALCYAADRLLRPFGRRRLGRVSEWAVVTGCVDVDGRVNSVRGYPQKLAAVRAAGCRAIVPRQDLETAQAALTHGPALSGVTRVEDAVAAIEHRWLGVRPRPAGLAAVACVALALAGWAFAHDNPPTAPDAAGPHLGPSHSRWNGGELESGEPGPGEGDGPAGSAPTQKGVAAKPSGGPDVEVPAVASPVNQPPPPQPPHSVLTPGPSPSSTLVGPGSVAPDAAGLVFRGDSSDPLPAWRPYASGRDPPWFQSLEPCGFAVDIGRPADAPRPGGSAENTVVFVAVVAEPVRAESMAALVSTLAMTDHCRTWNASDPITGLPATFIKQTGSVGLGPDGGWAAVRFAIDVDQPGMARAEGQVVLVSRSGSTKVTLVVARAGGSGPGRVNLEHILRSFDQWATRPVG